MSKRINYLIQQSGQKDLSDLSFSVTESPTSLSPIQKARTTSITSSDISQLQSLGFNKDKVSQSHNKHTKLNNYQVKPITLQPKTPRPDFIPLNNLKFGSPKPDSLPINNYSFVAPKSKTLREKMRLKLQDQKKLIQHQIQDKRKQIQILQIQINQLQQLRLEKKKQQDDSETFRRMLVIKENQLFNLAIIHAQIIQGVKNDILEEKATKAATIAKIQQCKQKIERLKQNKMKKDEKMAEYRSVLRKKQEIAAQLEEKISIANQKTKILRQASVQMISEIMKEEKSKLEQNIKPLIFSVRQAQAKAENMADFQQTLIELGITPKQYYTCNQLKYVPQFSCRQTKQNTQIMQIFANQLNAVLENNQALVQDSQAITDAKQQLKRLNKQKQLSFNDLRVKQEELQRLRNQERTFKAQQLSSLRKNQ